MVGHTLVPVVTFTEGDDPIAFMEFLLAQGVECIEVTLRTPQGIEAIAQLKKHYGDKALIGAGTVIHEEQVARLAGLKADFMVILIGVVIIGIIYFFL